MNGIVILNKEKGISSNTACRKVGKILGEKKVGHLGTLDVLATGVLPVALGKCTKLFDYYLQKTKTYIAQFTFGYETITLDSEGEVVNKSEKIPTKQEILDVIPSFIGRQSQMPPKFSAKKVNGRCAYDLMREGVEFDLKPKEIEIFDFKLLSQVNNSTFEFEIMCSAGTYIRSIARDLATKLNTYATMTDLIRTRCGKFEIKNAHTLEEIENIKENALIKVDEIFDEFDKIQVDDNETKKLLCGMTIIKNCKINGVAVIKNNNIIIGLASVIDSHIKLTLHLT